MTGFIWKSPPIKDAEPTPPPPLSEQPLVSDADLPPIRLGAGGLLGRPSGTGRPSVDADELVQPAEFDRFGDPVWSEPRAPGKAIPPSCLRMLSSPLTLHRGGGCMNHYGGMCPGTQRDGGCLVDIVRRAQELGLDWKFEINREVGDAPEGYWDYCGESFPDDSD